MRADLSAHLLAEQVRTLDVLELGRVHAGWTGPVVIRTLDDRGRPLGTLAAARLRLEASRTGHAVTLVLEEGQERVGGRVVPFAASPDGGDRAVGTRRIHLPGADPGPWIAAFPELFDPDALVTIPDDGRHDRLALRLTIDALLRGSTSAGHWRLRELGGVVDGDLMGVQLVELDARGSELRRLFADRARVQVSGGSIVLVLSDGVVARGGSKAPFLSGVYRVYLPGADPGRWREAGVPGI
jgi:hypothetical protein